MMDLSLCTWSEYTEDGFLGLQLDAFAENGRGISAFHHLSPLGFDARPVDPEGEVGALGWRMFDAKEGFGFPLNDVRTERALPNLNKGATRVFDTGRRKGVPFYFTQTFDPITATATIESHRAGGKIILKNQEGVQVAISGTTVKVTGASSVECGGTKELAIFDPLKAALDAVSTALAKLATNAYNSAAVDSITEAKGRILAFGNLGKTQITKGA